MGWTAEQKRQSREKIVNSAAELFTMEGYDNVGINDVMAHAGLTRGAFYNHFESKSALYAEAIVNAADIAKRTTLEKSGLKFADIIQAYLSKEHREGEFHCPLAFLATDIHQREDNVRNTYTQTLQGFINSIQQTLQKQRQQEEAHQEADVDAAEAMKVAVLMIGGVAIARAVNDDALAEQLLNACREGVGA